MVAILNKRSHDHPNWCEDNHFLYEDDIKIVGAALDGCSTGKDSYWASKTFSNIFNCLTPDWNNFVVYNSSNSNWDLYTTELFLDFAEKLQIISKILLLTDNQLLSTIVFFVYHKESQKLYVKFLGDGAFFYKKLDSEQKLVINDENNTPLYLGYYYAEQNGSFRSYLRTRPNYTIENVTEFSICSDGIFRFKLPPSKNEPEILHDPIQFLTDDDYLSNLKSSLSRKFNILTKEGWIIEDDLTIIRYK